MELDRKIKILPEKIYIPKFKDGSSATGIRTQKEQCKITFEDRFWLSQNGYQGEMNRKNAESIRVETLERNQMENAGRMTGLTKVLAYATIALVLVEIIKMTIEYGHLLGAIRFWTFADVLIAGLILGIILALIIVQQAKRRSE